MRAILCILRFVHIEFCERRCNQAYQEHLISFCYYLFYPFLIRGNLFNAQKLCIRFDWNIKFWRVHCTSNAKAAGAVKAARAVKTALTTVAPTALALSAPALPTSALLTPRWRSAILFKKEIHISTSAFQSYSFFIFTKKRNIKIFSLHAIMRKIFRNQYNKFTV